MLSPPVISGSHTLQHPRQKQNEMAATHHHANHLQQQHLQAIARPLGTHTLGRLPSHNHSPSHSVSNGHNKNGNMQAVDLFYRQPRYLKINVTLKCNAIWIFHNQQLTQDQIMENTQPLANSAKL